MTVDEAKVNGLIIQVSGKANTGKTTVARLIEETLRKEGFTDVTVYDDTKDSSPDKEPIQVRAEKTKQRVVVIETVRTT